MYNGFQTNTRLLTYSLSALMLLSTFGVGARSYVNAAKVYMHTLIFKQSIMTVHNVYIPVSLLRTMLFRILPSGFKLSACAC